MTRRGRSHAREWFRWAVLLAVLPVGVVSVLVVLI